MLSNTLAIRDRHPADVRPGPGWKPGRGRAGLDRQAFVPGEITPEESNRIGNERAMHRTEGTHAFFVATHIDRHHT